MRQNRGFSLIELVVVVTIVGLLLVVSIPRFGHYRESMKLSGDSDRIATHLRTARSAAIMKNINAVFQIDTANKRYFYFEDDDRDGTADAAEYRSAVTEFSTGISVTHTLSAPRITFEPKGNTLEGGTITLTNLNNNTRTVRISGGTGNIRVD